MLNVKQLINDLNALRNELCYKCGNYAKSYNGACDGCRWKDYEVPDVH